MKSRADGGNPSALDAHRAGEDIARAADAGFQLWLNKWGGAAGSRCVTGLRPPPSVDAVVTAAASASESLTLISCSHSSPFSAPPPSTHPPSQTINQNALTSTMKEK